MSFKVGDKVRIRATGDEGVVDGANLKHSPPRLLVSYTKASGAQYHDWFGEEDLDAADGAPADAGGAADQGTGDQAGTVADSAAAGGEA